MTFLTTRRRIYTLSAASAALALTLAGCSSSDPAEDDESSEATTIEVEDNHGTQTVSVPPQSVVATDNRLFETLAEWDVELAAAPVDLIAADNPYKEDESIVNLGSHNEPDLEAIVGVEPDLVLNGQRFASYYEDITSLVPDATVIELDPREGEPFDEELKRQIEVLGQIFDREDDAQALIDDFDEAIERVEAAYDPEDRVIGLITSGGEINYAAPTTGRTVGPVFDILGLTPAIDAEGSTDHQGDDISVEAVADANPDLILVLDRDAAISASSEEAYVPANELIAESPALQNVTAVQNDNIVYFPQYTYVNEGIQTYTQFFNDLADKLEENS